MNNIAGAPLPEPEPTPRVTGLPPTSKTESAAEIPAETALAVDPGYIEGEFVETIPPATPQRPAGKIVEPTKRKFSPALLALFTILGLFALCCLMAIIVFFLVYPTAKNTIQTGHILQPIVALGSAVLTW